MTTKEEKRLASQIAGWLEGEGPAPTGDPTARAVARTAVMLVDALAPTPLHPVTRARLFERALAEARPGITFNDAIEDPWGELWRAARQLPAPAWLGLGALAAGLVVAGVLLRQHLLEGPGAETEVQGARTPRP